MNRGSALKWIDALGAARAKFTTSQLSFVEPSDEIHYCPIGVLANFLAPNDWTLAWDKCSQLMHGQQFFLPSDLLQKVKAKTNLNAFTQCHSFADAAKFVRDNYKQL